ncbi:hypothetical protein NP493_318g03025 [Ridgeia piscesae]|uniref:Fibronectin type-III domain-containing protein n=1 Tax=Ridgeia piscesae TaxID=27915 RepID=A0AAD9L4V1_RIDPI|nr:hypothetical protein NP493_318g03025 [Ridgeia piscesae]
MCADSTPTLCGLASVLRLDDKLCGLASVPPPGGPKEPTTLCGLATDLVWAVNSHVEVDTFEITVRYSADLLQERIRIEIPGIRRQYTLHDLHPLVEYHVVISAANERGSSAPSNRIVFHTMLG